MTSVHHHHLVPERYYDNTPQGMEGHPILYMITLFSLLLVTLLAMEWQWRLGWSILEDKLPAKHPGTAVRLILLFLLMSLLMRIIPDVIKLGLWQDLSPDGRMLLFEIDGAMDTFSFIPFSFAWLFAYLGGPMIVYQLRRFPLPLHLWPTLDKMKRPLKIGIGVMVIAILIVTVG